MNNGGEDHPVGVVFSLCESEYFSGTQRYAALHEAREDGSAGRARAMKKTRIASNNARFIKIFVSIFANISLAIVDFYTNICYTLVSTFKEDCLCIERLWAS